MAVPVGLRKQALACFRPRCARIIRRPPVHMPKRKSLGSTLIESALPRPQLGGTGQLILALSGLSLTLTLPGDRLRPETV